MTKKKSLKKDSKRVKRNFAKPLTWIMNNLSEQEIAYADETSPDLTEVFDFFVQCVDQGIEVKLSFDTYSDCYQASAIGAWVDFPSEGYATSGRSSRDMADAILMLWYRVATKAEYDLGSVAPDDAVDDIRG